MTMLTLLAALALVPSRGSAQTVSTESLTLEQRVEALERRQEMAGWQKDGFALRSADGGFKLKLGGCVQADSRWYLNKELSTMPSQFIVRRARVAFDAVVRKYFELKIMPDFGGSAPTLQDAFVDFNFRKDFRLRAGKFKQPVGLENLQSDNNLIFVERSAATGLVPQRDPGLMLHGELEMLQYNVSVFNGVADGANADGDVDTRKDAAARLFFVPFKEASGPLKTLGLGIAGTIGSARAGNSSLPIYRSQSQLTAFTYAGGSTSDGGRRRYTPHFYWYPGRAGLMGEYVQSSHRVRNGAAIQTLDHRAWNAAASYLLTDDKSSYTGVKPAKPFDPALGTWGAFEVAGRYGELWFDRDAEPLFASATQARSVRSATAAVNWYINENAKIMADYEYAFIAGGGRRLEQAVLTRIQFQF